MTSGSIQFLHASAGIPDESIIAGLCSTENSESPLEKKSLGEVPETIADAISILMEDATLQPIPAGASPVDAGGDPTLWLYRDRTIGMLKRYLRMSIEVGRLPSLLGREFFRTRVTSYTVGTFEDAVIFVHDVECALEKLDEFEKKLVAKMIFQEYSQDEAARLLGCGRRTLVRRFPETIDKLSEIFLKGDLIDRLPTTISNRENACQEGESDENCASDCESSE
ncbi:MAG TPA: hypothetical protein VFA74_09800 [Terriglobales bacterium]|nr:hypothetical protein [Terriglobales bacterium]